MAKWFPSVFLDTNILRSNNGKDIFRNKYIKWLQLYRSLTNAKIYTSEAFEQELYYQEEQRLKNTAKEIDMIKLRYPTYDIPNLNQEVLFNNYKKQIQEFFSVIISGNSVNISECIKRAVRKTPPCTETKEEFRDTIWWLSYLQLIQKWENCIFISDDDDFRWCEKEHINAKRLNSLYQFFNELNNAFLGITVSKEELLTAFPLTEIEWYLQYKDLSDSKIELFIDKSWTDYFVEATNDIQNVGTSIVCTSLEWNKYTFSFTVSFLCWFKVYDDSREEVTDDLLTDWGIFEDVNWQFVYENNEIKIDYDKISTEIESVSIYWTLEDMALDYYSDLHSGR